MESEHLHFQNQWTKMDQMGEFNSDEDYIYYCGQESLRRNGLAIMVNRRIRNAVPGCSLKNDDRMISVRFQGKPFNITVIQLCALTSNAEEADWTVLWKPTRPFRTNTQKRCPFHYRGLECKSRKSRNTCPNSKFGLGVQNEAWQRLLEFWQENALVIANTLFQ